MRVEGVVSHDKKIDTDTYFQGFARPDVQVVADMASHITRTDQPVTSIAIRKLTREQNGKAIVYVEENTKQGAVWTELNWAAPGLPPMVYDRYARDFYSFTGDYGIQMKRAKLLAEVLQKPISEIDGISQNSLHIPSLGVIMLNNPLKPNPFDPKIIINTGSHLLRK